MEPLMDVITHGFAKVCKAGKVKAVKSGKLKFSEAAIKYFPVPCWQFCQSWGCPWQQDSGQR